MMMIEMKRKEMDNKKIKAIIKTHLVFQKKTKKNKNKLFDGNQVSSTFCSGKLFLLQNFISLLNV